MFAVSAVAHRRLSPRHSAFSSRPGERRQSEAQPGGLMLPLEVLLEQIRQIDRRGASRNVREGNSRGIGLQACYTTLVLAGSRKYDPHYILERLVLQPLDDFEAFARHQSIELDHVGRWKLVSGRPSRVRNIRRNILSAHERAEKAATLLFAERQLDLKTVLPGIVHGEDQISFLRQFCHNQIPFHPMLTASSKTPPVSRCEAGSGPIVQTRAA